MPATKRGDSVAPSARARKHLMLLSAKPKPVVAAMSRLSLHSVAELCAKRASSASSRRPPRPFLPLYLSRPLSCLFEALTRLQVSHDQRQIKP